MGDGQDRSRVFREVLLEPVDALRVEVVGGLVEQQQVRLLEQQRAERDPAPSPPDRVDTCASGGGQRSASIACSIVLSSSQPLRCSICSIRSPCSAMSESKSASGSPMAADTSSKRASAARVSATASSTLPRTSFVSSSSGSCMRMPTE